MTKLWYGKIYLNLQSMHQNSNETSDRPALSMFINEFTM